MGVFHLKAIITEDPSFFSGQIVVLTNSTHQSYVTLEYRYAISPAPLIIPSLERSFFIGEQSENLEYDKKDRSERGSKNTKMEILEIQKEISILNNFVVNMNFDRIETTSQSLTWTNLSTDKTFLLRKKEKLLTLTFRSSMKDLPAPFSNEFLIFQSGSLFFPIKILFYDKTLRYSMTQADKFHVAEYQSSKALDFNFGNIAIGEV